MRLEPGGCQDARIDAEGGVCMSNHPRADMYLAERERGLSYQQIADKYGVSRQTVGQACASRGGYFRTYTEDTCVYPYLRQWLNENRITRNEFIRLMGLIPCANENIRFGFYFRGEHYPSKQTIDKMLAVTGLTYEQLFYREDKDA